jgi:hypothetical protein
MVNCRFRIGVCRLKLIGIWQSQIENPMAQLSGRVVDPSGNGVAGVTVTLSGKQSASVQTDSQSKYVFNYLSASASSSSDHNPQITQITPIDMTREDAEA